MINDKIRFEDFLANLIFSILEDQSLSRTNIPDDVEIVKVIVFFPFFNYPIVTSIEYDFFSLCKEQIDTVKKG